MKNLAKRLFAVLLTALMIVSCMVPVYAASSPSKTKLTSSNVSVKNYTYDGTTKTAKITVKANGKTLKKGTDYTLSGTTKAKKVGTYKVTVKGIGVYTGTVTAKWTISKRTLKSSNVSAKSYTYNGKTRTTKVTVKVNGKTLKKGTDYTLSGTTKAKKVGTYKVTVKGKGAYSGKVTVKWKITKKAQSLKATVSNKTSISVKASAVKKKAKTYTIKVKGAKGKVTYKATASKSKYKKYISVKSGKITLKKGIKKGTYKVTVTSAATKNYKKATKTIKIKIK